MRKKFSMLFVVNIMSVIVVYGQSNVSLSMLMGKLPQNLNSLEKVILVDIMAFYLSTLYKYSSAAFQSGRLKNASISQLSSLSDATQTSEGTRENAVYTWLKASLYKEGGEGKEAIQTQTMSSGNATDIFLNYANAYQNESSNFAEQTQTGGNNISYVSQTGDGNSANLTQNQTIIH